MNRTIPILALATARRAGRQGMWKRCLCMLLAGSITAALATTPAVGIHVPGVHASPPLRILAGETPDAVVHGSATLRGHHNPDATLTLDIGLGAHNPAQLDALIAAASDPASPQYAHYLSNEQYLAQFAPTSQEVQDVRDWATGSGLTVRAASPDNLLVTVSGTTGRVERALGVTINDYSLPDRTFMSNDRDPVVPGGLNVRAISGLTTIHRFHPVLGRALAMRTGGFYPYDFRTAYNVAAVVDGSGQTIGLTLWGASVAQSDLNTFATTTGTPALVSGQAGANGIDWIPVNGNTGTSTTDVQTEIAMDVEYAHGVAPNSHLKYWLGDCSYDLLSGTCQPSDVGLEQAISAAANDPSVHVVSNSWLSPEATSTSDPFVSNTNASFQHAATVGTTFYFASGDAGSESGGFSLPGYPADSPYVVSVGGTTLNTDTTFAYGSESAWSGSGGGCSSVFARPSWQTGVSAATCAGRAEPDVAANADPNTGAYVYVEGAAQQVGGTSLATPLWTGMAAVLNRYLGVNGKPLMGFSAPRLYRLATSATTYSRDFHDVTSGNNGYPAGPGWDEATGWGSPNLANLAADWSGSSMPTSTPTTAPSATATSTPVRPTATATPRSTATITPAPTATAPPVTGGPASGTHSGSISTTGGFDTYTFIPGVSGTATVGMCAAYTGNDFDLYVYNSAGTKVASSTTSSYCEWASLSVSAGQTYTVKTVAYSGTGTYRAAWNVNGAQVVWNVSGSIGASGGYQYFSFPILSAHTIAMSTCGPSGTDFDLYLEDAAYNILASSTAPSTCEALSYTPSYRGLFRLVEVSYSGTGAWSGTIKTY